MSTGQKIDYKSNIEAHVPTVLFDPVVKAKLDRYIKHCTTELTGFGLVKVIERGYFFVYDIFLIDQEATSASADPDTSSIGELMMQLVDQGVPMEDFRFWWHSHASMGVFWSTTDKTTMDGFHCPWMISYVGNHAGDALLCLDVYEPFRIVANKLNWRVHYPLPEGLDQEIKTEIGAKVRKPSYQSNWQGGYQGTGYQGNHNASSRPGANQGAGNQSSTTKPQTTSTGLVGTATGIYSKDDYEEVTLPGGQKIWQLKSSVAAASKGESDGKSGGGVVVAGANGKLKTKPTPNELVAARFPLFMALCVENPIANQRMDAIELLVAKDGGAKNPALTDEKESEVQGSVEEPKDLAPAC